MGLKEMRGKGRKGNWEEIKGEKREVIKSEGKRLKRKKWGKQGGKDRAKNKNGKERNEKEREECEWGVKKSEVGAECKEQDRALGETNIHVVYTYT